MRRILTTTRRSRPTRRVSARRPDFSCPSGKSCSWPPAASRPGRTPKSSSTTPSSSDLTATAPAFKLKSLPQLEYCGEKTPSVWISLLVIRLLVRNEGKSIPKEKPMNKKLGKAIVLRTLALIVVLCASWQAHAQTAKMSYPSKAPLDQYLIADRNAEIAMARSAAPEAISRDAAVWVLG